MRNKFYEEKARVLQDCADRCDMRPTFASTKEVYGGKRNNTVGAASGDVVIQKDGTESVTVLQLIDRWVEHCSEVLSHNDPIDMIYVKAELLELGSRSPPELALDRDFAMDELLIALSAMKHEKATGLDNISIEVLKFTESELLLDGVLSSFNVALRTGNVQSGWRDVIITTLQKKGDPKVCDNYRTLSLINHIGKVLENDSISA